MTAQGHEELYCSSDDAADDAGEAAGGGVVAAGGTIPSGTIASNKDLALIRIMFASRLIFFARQSWIQITSAFSIRTMVLLWVFTTLFASFVKDIAAVLRMFFSSFYIYRTVDSLRPYCRATLA